MRYPKAEGPKPEIVVPTSFSPAIRGYFVFMTDLVGPLSSLPLRIKGAMDFSRVEEFDLLVAPAFKCDGV